MRVYISSTYEDLIEFRTAAAQLLRQLGHEVIAMEDYVAESSIPLNKVLKDVSSCDALISIAAWRYGYVPETGPMDIPGATPGVTSITEYEYRKALQENKQILPFLLEDRNSWPAPYIDGIGNHVSPEPIRSLREELREQHLVCFFSSPDSLARQVAVSISSVGMRSEVQRQLVDIMGNIDFFTANEYLTDSATMPIVALAEQSIRPPAVMIDLSNPWWSTRLYLLAAVGQEMWDLQRIVVLENQTFAGIVSAVSVRRVLRRIHKEAEKFDVKVLPVVAGADVRQIADNYLLKWNSIIGAQPGDVSAERNIAQNVTVPNLRLWLGEAFVETPITLEDVDALSPIDIMRIMDYPNDFVPVVSRANDSLPPVHLVNKRDLSDRLARNSVAEMLDRLGTG
ncbi:MAG: DUF4062 domain-containing protein [Gammaproteobacteria bacterium]|nr:DUF4062 domain-containing protein [Gammaproteobacteria bacterium]